MTTSLKKNHEFRRLYSKGQSAASKCVVVYSRRNYTDKDGTGKRLTGIDGKAVNRLGITVSKKLGNAVRRNRIRRRIREVYRLNEHLLNTGYDIVIVARSRSYDAAWDELHSSVLYPFKKLGLLKEPPM